MDFLDPKKQKQHRTRLYIGYFLMVIAVSLVSLLLVFLAYGYTFNFQTGDINQNGLVFVGAHPESAQVYVNGQLKGDTDQRLIMPAAEYTVELRREGYRNWQNSFTLFGGKIERLVYPFLFPEKLVTSEVQLYAAKPTFATQSPDRRLLIVRRPGAAINFDLVDLNAEPNISTGLALPANLFNQTGSRHDIELVEWSTDNRHVVLKHTFDTGVEFVLLDSETPPASRNLSVIFAGAEFTDISLRNKRFDRYYLHNQPARLLMTADLSGAEPVNALNGVMRYKSHGEDVLLYVTNADAAEGRVLVRVREGEQTYTIRDLPVDSTYLLDIARFNNRWYVVAGSVADERIYILRDPVAALRRNPETRLIPVSTLRVEDAQFASFSANARFVGVQSGSRFVVYDAENNRSHRYDTGLELTARQKAVWMDGHRLALVSKGQLHVYDFDGTNRQALSGAYGEFPPFFNGGYNAVFTLTDSQVAGRATLLRTELIVKPAQ